MAPEYAMEGQLSVKADVYSFGILLLELISGRKSIDLNLEDDMRILSEWVRGLNEGGNLVSMIDPIIIETCSDKGEQALKCIHVGLLCTQAKESLRPSMSRINLMLSTDPTKPGFVNDTKSTPISGASQAYAQNDPLSTLSSFVSPASAHTPIEGPSRNSATRSNPVASTTVPSTRGLEKLRFWKAKFWRALWTSKREKSGYLVHGHVEEQTSISRDGQISFTLEALLAATKKFHDDNKLGEGGFGPVYKGITADGLQIAVKKLSIISKQGKREFLNEVELLAKVRHRNLVNVLGCCAEGSQILLVYKYLPNGSLDKILFYPNERIQLDWKKRYNIILGIARGLLYLHQDSPVRIIHRDIKAGNILLDEKLNPKISDFGLARLFPEDEDETHVSTRVAGT